MLLAVNPYESMLQNFACSKLHGNRHCCYILNAVTWKWSRWLQTHVPSLFNTGNVTYFLENWRLRGARMLMAVWWGFLLGCDAVSLDNWSEMVDFFSRHTRIIIYKRAPIFRRVYKIVRSHCWLRPVCPSARNISASTGRVFMKFRIWVFFENLSGTFKRHEVWYD
jgi:hypothetical protein